jgi:hypothetical protein
VGPTRALDRHVPGSGESDAYVAELAPEPKERHHEIVPDAHLIAAPQIEDEVPDWRAHG